MAHVKNVRGGPGDEDSRPPPRRPIDAKGKVKRPDFREGKSIESKCNKTVVDHITQILVEYHIHTTIKSEYK